MFGYAWKINFPEIIFNWPGVLKALTRKWFEVKIFTSNHFRTHAHRQRERERAFDFGFADHSLRLRLWLRRLRRSQPSNSTSPIYEPTNLRTDHAFDFADHAFNFVDLRTHEPIFDPEPSTHEPSTSPATQSLRATNRSSTLRFRPRAMNPQTDLSLCVILIFCVILIDPRTHEPLISNFFFFFFCGGVGGGVLMVFLLCSGGFCVGSGEK